MIKIKLVYSNITKLLIFKENDYSISYDLLINKFYDKFTNAPNRKDIKEVKFEYQDSEGDTVTISSDEDLIEAIDAMCYKFTVIVKYGVVDKLSTSEITTQRVQTLLTPRGNVSRSSTWEVGITRRGFSDSKSEGESGESGKLGKSGKLFSGGNLVRTERNDIEYKADIADLGCLNVIEELKIERETSNLDSFNSVGVNTDSVHNSILDHQLFTKTFKFSPDSLVDFFSKICKSETIIKLMRNHFKENDFQGENEYKFIDFSKFLIFFEKQIQLFCEESYFSESKKDPLSTHIQFPNLTIFSKLSEEANDIKQPQDDDSLFIDFGNEDESIFEQKDPDENFALKFKNQRKRLKNESLSSNENKGGLVDIARSIVRDEISSENPSWGEHESSISKSGGSSGKLNSNRDPRNSAPIDNNISIKEKNLENEEDNSFIFHITEADDAKISSNEIITPKVTKYTAIPIKPPE